MPIRLAGRKNFHIAQVLRWPSETPPRTEVGGRQASGAARFDIAMA
jgi:hypothetical protein